MSFFEELKRRNVFRVGIAYAVAAWLLLQIADVLIDNIGAPDWVFPTLLTVLGIGLPLALILAWAFELTPEGIKRESDVERAESITPQTGRKLDRAIIVILTLAVGYLLVDKLVLNGVRLSDELTAVNDYAESEFGYPAPATRPEAPQNNSIAVLPFTNMSADPENEYFSDGLTDTLLHMLAQIQALDVAARTSSFSFKGKDATIGEIAEALNVAHVLEGSVQRAGGQVRVTAQLIRADDGFHVWSQNYTRPLEDIFAIQDEIAADVANALDASLLGGGAPSMIGPATANVSAYDLYLKALDAQATFSFGSLNTAEGLFKAALAADPDFIDARIGLARNYLLMHQTGMISDDEIEQLLRPQLDQVRLARPDSPHARAFELMLENNSSGVKTPDEIREVIAELMGLLVVIPDELAMRIQVAGMVRFVERDEQARLDVLRAGLLVDPRSAYLHASIGNSLRRLDRLDEAEAALQRAIELDPLLPGIYVRLYWLAEDRNDLPAALDWARRATEVDPHDHELAMQLAEVFYQLELPEEGDRWARRVEALVPGSDFVRSLAVARAASRGEFDAVMTLASDIISAPPNERMGIYDKALNAYGEAALRQGRAQEAYDFFMSVDPEVAAIGELASSRTIIDLRTQAFRMMMQIAEPEALKQAHEYFMAQFANLGWREGDWGQMLGHFVNGEYDEAVAPALEVLSYPIADRPDIGWLATFRTNFAPVSDDPAVAARLNEREREWREVRNEVVAMLAEPEWQ